MCGGTNEAIVVVVLNNLDYSQGQLNFDIMYSDNMVYTRREKMHITTKIHYEVTSLIHSLHSAYGNQFSVSF
jgi:hypothetical protein